MNNKLILKISIVFCALFCFMLCPNNVLAEETESANTESIITEQHKVQTIITKVDENGNPLSGATLQIIDSEGNIVDQWVSDGTEHIVMLEEGDYILHEQEAPFGYNAAADQSFTIKVEVKDLDAGVDFSETPCNHYGGTPLYYVEIDGHKSEVYCINQDWETPDENSTYDGGVLSYDDIRDYMQQTVYIDAHENKEKIDVSDQSLSDEELYNKILDIIYHRELASDIFTDLTEAEIRYVTESALKNYTNTGLTRVQKILTSQAPTNYDLYDYYTVGNYTWYLYPWYRSFTYNPDAAMGQSIYTTVVGTGDAFGNLARHWSDAHGAKNNAAVREKVARYYELYQYLISDTDHHPSDMHLYIYSTNDKSLDWSNYDFDEGAYQNLLGVTWYNPYDDDNKVELTVVNTKMNPQTNDDMMIYFIILGMSGLGLTSMFLRLNFRQKAFA